MDFLAQQPLRQDVLSLRCLFSEERKAPAAQIPSQSPRKLLSETAPSKGFVPHSSSGYICQCEDSLCQKPAFAGLAEPLHVPSACSDPRDQGGGRS